MYFSHRLDNPQYCLLYTAHFCSCFEKKFPLCVKIKPYLECVCKCRTVFRKWTQITKYKENSWPTATLNEMKPSWIIFGDSFRHVITARQRSCGKVMFFSHVSLSVIPSVQRVEVPMWPLCSGPVPCPHHSGPLRPWPPCHTRRPLQTMFKTCWKVGGWPSTERTSFLFLLIQNTC